MPLNVDQVPLQHAYCKHNAPYIILHCKGRGVQINPIQLSIYNYIYICGLYTTHFSLKNVGEFQHFCCSKGRAHFETIFLSNLALAWFLAVHPNVTNRFRKYMLLSTSHYITVLFGKKIKRFKPRCCKYCSLSCQFSFGSLVAACSSHDFAETLICWTPTIHSGRAISCI